MSKNINKIVIVGGGSAGWMSASTLISQFPDKEIVVIESPNVPTIGVGESTIGGIRNWLNLIGLDEDDFLTDTDASYKLSIKFTDFYRKDGGSFHYPFGYPHTAGNVADKNDWYFKKLRFPETPISDYATSMYSNMALVNNNRISKDEGSVFPGYNFYKDTAFHFDATKFAIWLRDKFAKPNGVKHIQAEVKESIVGEDGIDYLILDNGDSVKADLFIDCTGFKSMLLGDALGEKFNSYSDILPNNSAWATRVPYVDKEKELVAYTECTAIENGWVWNIPLWSRVGTGYVYSDKYVSDAEALEEFKRYLTTKGTDVNGLEFKNIKMRVGIHERLWVKNVCAIGLSAGFIEPLESSGLFTVHEFLFKLVRTLGRGGYVSQWDKDAFSTSCVKMFRNFAEFVALHYALSHRDDTEYWRDVGKREYKGSTTFNDAINERFDNFHYFNNFGGFHCILTGMNYFATDIHSIVSHNYKKDVDWDNVFLEATKKLEIKKQQWASAAKKEPTLMEFLKEKYEK